MSNASLETCKFEHPEMKIEFLYKQQSTRISVQIDDFDGEQLSANLEISHPENQESLNVVIPWNRQTFQFTGKHLCLPATGTVKIGTQQFSIDPVESFAVLDTGRGVWPRQSSWNWAMASQRSLGKTIGLNFGGKWTDGTGMTENAFFVNGKMNKIHEDILFHYDREDYKKPWVISTKFSDDVKLEFTPFFERVSKSDIKLVKSEVHQLFGYYNGYVRYEDGKRLKISQLLGSIEDHYAKW